jgi:hypothetical protein
VPPNTPPLLEPLEEALAPLLLPPPLLPLLPLLASFPKPGLEDDEQAAGASASKAGTRSERT